MNVDYYREPGPLTQLTPEQATMVRTLEPDPETLCLVVHGLVVHPPHATAAGLTDDRVSERNTRPAADLLARLLELDDAPIDEPRPANQRIVGTCRHFAVLSCAFLRAHHIAARARCGFATYFQPGLSVDHWITEYRDDSRERWVRIDSEILGLDPSFVAHPDDLAPGEFLSGGEAWALHRRGLTDPMTYGVHGTADAWGPPEIIGNTIRDLAALNKVEMLPWDEWGPMEACYRHEVPDGTEAVIDAVADACADDDYRRITELYETLTVPDDIGA